MLETLSSGDGAGDRKRPSAASHDVHPRLSIIPELATSLESSSNPSSHRSILSSINSIAAEFRHSSDDRHYCLYALASPLLETFLKDAELSAVSEESDDIFESQRLCCEIFYLLNPMELPQFSSEDYMSAWMLAFICYLAATYTRVVEATGIVDSLRAAICKSVLLCMKTNEEKFVMSYCFVLTSQVYRLLTTTTSRGPHDQLVANGILYLTAVSRSSSPFFFREREVLQKMCESVVFPNVMLKEEDGEVFTMKYIEYLVEGELFDDIMSCIESAASTDMEWSKLDTRRRIVIELLRGIALNYKDQVEELVSGHIQKMLSLYATNPKENWRQKECSYYLVASLGADQMELVDVESFYASYIVPELQGSDVNASSMLKAGALMFFKAYHEQIPKQAVTASLKDMIGLLKAYSNVVRSCAAICIEKILSMEGVVQVRPNDIASQLVCNALNIDLFLFPLLTNLFEALKFPESRKYPYVIKCVTMVFKVTNICGEVAEFCIDSLTSIFVETCHNPKSPVFSNYLLDATTSLIRRSCESDPSLTGMFEARLFPALQNILVDDISEFWPCAFTHQYQLLDNCMQLFFVLLSHDYWRRSANVPALIRLLQLQKVTNNIYNVDKFIYSLDELFRLVMAPRKEVLVFCVLGTAVLNLSYEFLVPCIRDLWAYLFTRLENEPTVQFVSFFVIFISLVLVKYGPLVLVDSMDVVLQNKAVAILRQFWVPNLKLISGPIELKLASVASTRLICEYPGLLDPAEVELWGKMLNSIITLLVQPYQDRVVLEANVQDIQENTGYSALFALLQNVWKEEDPLKEMKDPKEYLVTSLARLSAISPGWYPAAIEKYVDLSNRVVLLQLCDAYDCNIL